MMRYAMRLLVIFAAVAALTRVPAVAADKDGNKNGDNTEREEKMLDLGRLADREFGFPAELHYMKQLYNMSAGGTGKTENKFKALAISHICRYYYNAEKYDSVMEWSNKINGVELSDDVYSLYFDTKYYDCSASLERGDVEKALGKALSMQKDAQNLQSEDGEVTCYEMLGDIYMKTKMYKQAVDAYVCGYEILKKQNARDTYRFQLLSQVMECCHDSGDKATFSRYLKEMKSIFDEGGIAKQQGSLYWRCLKLYYAYSLEDVVRRNVVQSVDAAYRRLIACDKIDDWFVEGRSASVLAEYYVYMGRYREALEELSLLDDSQVISYSELCDLKGSVYDKMHDFKRSTEFYSLGYDSLEATYNNSLLSEFRQFQEICHEQYNTRVQRAYAAERQRMSIVYFSIILVMAVVLVALFAYHVRRSGILADRLVSSEQRLRTDESVLMQRQTVLRGALERHKNNGRMKSMFLSQMSHEIRTPLNAIVGFSGLLVENANVSDEEREYVDIIRKNSDSLTLLINNILDLGRLDSHRVAFVWQKCDLMSIINTALAPYAHNKAVKQIVESFSPYVEIETDAIRLGKVFDHIYSNAYKFTQEGYVKTVVKHSYGRLMVRVEDSGIGVPDDKKSLVFERFEKVDVFVQGSGLGLSICREILHRLGGDIYADKSYNSGFAVIVELPISKPKGAEAVLL